MASEELEEVIALMDLAVFPQYKKPREAKVAKEVQAALIRLVRQYSISGKLSFEQSTRKRVKRS